MWGPCCEGTHTYIVRLDHSHLTELPTPDIAPATKMTVCRRMHFTNIHKILHKYVSVCWSTSWSKAMCVAISRLLCVYVSSRAVHPHVQGIGTCSRHLSSRCVYNTYIQHPGCQWPATLTMSINFIIVIAECQSADYH